MHEASIALAIVDEVCERAASEHADSITNVRLRVGALTAIVPDALQFAWECATNGTIADGATLSIETIPLQIYCERCSGTQTIGGDPILTCPQCGTPARNIARGRELEVVAMEVRHAHPPDRSPAIDP